MGSSEVKFSATCYSDYVDDVNPFVLGKKNTPVNKKQGKFMVGTNLWCADSGSGGGVDVWHYPAGGSPYKNIPLTVAEPYGVILSIGTGK